MSPLGKASCGRRCWMFIFTAGRGGAGALCDLGTPTGHGGLCPLSPLSASPERARRHAPPATPSQETRRRGSGLGIWPHGCALGLFVSFLGRPAPKSRWTCPSGASWVRYHQVHQHGVILGSADTDYLLGGRSFQKAESRIPSQRAPSIALFGKQQASLGSACGWAG